MPLLGDLFKHYEPQIRRLPRSRPLEDRDLATQQFLLGSEGRFEIYYAPMDWVRPKARIAVVGITPGRDTMRIAYQTLVDGLAAGRAVSRVLDEVKAQASFSGFRSQLVQWLTWLGIPQHLGIPADEDFWESRRQLIHPTSAVRYPVFVDGKNYSGRSPDLLRHPLLRPYLYEVLAPELAAIPEALVVPLGEKVSDALVLLSSEGIIDLERCLVGFPHPSGQNGHRIRKWNENRAGLRRRAAAWYGRFG
jgi:hypothetical protein